MPTTSRSPISTTLDTGWGYTGATLWESVNGSGGGYANAGTSVVQFLCGINDLPQAANSVSTATHAYYMRRMGAQSPYIAGRTLNPTQTSAYRGPLSYTLYGDVVSGLDTVAEANTVTIGCISQTASGTDGRVDYIYLNTTFTLLAQGGYSSGFGPGGILAALWELTSGIGLCREQLVPLMRAANRLAFRWSRGNPCLMERLDVTDIEPLWRNLKEWSFPVHFDFGGVA